MKIFKITVRDEYFTDYIIYAEDAGKAWDTVFDDETYHPEKYGENFYISEPEEIKKRKA
jgi:hypothetical protein